MPKPIPQTDLMGEIIIYINILKLYVYSEVQPNWDLYKLVEFQPGIHFFVF